MNNMLISLTWLAHLKGVISNNIPYVLSDFTDLASYHRLKLLDKYSSSWPLNDTQNENTSQPEWKNRDQNLHQQLIASQPANVSQHNLAVQNSFKSETALSPHSLHSD